MKKLVEKYQKKLLGSGDTPLDPFVPEEWCTTIEKGDKRTMEEYVSRVCSFIISSDV